MTTRDIFLELKEGLESFIEFQDGKKTLKTHKVSLNKKPELSAQELIAIRVKLNVSQAIMADLICAQLKTYQNWEQGLSKPNKQAILLIKIIARNPESLKELEAVC